MKSTKAITDEVRAIILKHAHPVRIYLYGSAASGESSAGSDIDIAYDDDNFKDHHLIEEDVQNIATLIKIDVKNIAGTDDRFKNRVRSTGKVLYSATKELRAQDGLYNFSNALDQYSYAVDCYERLKLEGFEDLYLDLISKRFEFTFEMSWKALKRYLDFLGIDAKNPRQVFKEAYAQQLLSCEAIWLDMIEQRNLSSHVYDESEIGRIMGKREDYLQAFLSLKKVLENGLSASNAE